MPRPRDDDHPRAHRRPAGRPRARSAGSASRRTRSPSTRTRRVAGAGRRGHHAGRRCGGRSRRLRRGQGRRRDRGADPCLRHLDRGAGRAARRTAGGPHRAGGGPRPRVADVRPRRRGDRLRHDRRQRPEQRRAAPRSRPTGCSPRGDLLKIDFGARVDGYHADCTRTSVLGRARRLAARDPPGGTRRAAGGRRRDGRRRRGRRPRTPWPARCSTRRAGWSGSPPASGTASGLQIHEDPFVGPRNPGTLSDRTPVTMEPGVYLPGRGGVRIEDTLVVGAAHPRC